MGPGAQVEIYAKYIGFGYVDELLRSSLGSAQSIYKGEMKSRAAKTSGQ